VWEIEKIGLIMQKQLGLSWLSMGMWQGAYITQELIVLMLFISYLTV